MRKYEQIKRKIISELLSPGKLSLGDPFPAHTALRELYPASSQTYSKVTAELEREGLLARISPRKFVVAKTSATVSGESKTIGLIGFSGEVWQEIAEGLSNRLIARHHQVRLLNPFGGKLNARTMMTHFLKTDYDALVVRDNVDIPYKYIQKMRRQYKKIILLVNPYHKWSVPHSGVFVDMAFPIYDGLFRLRAAGCRKIACVIAPDPPGCLHERDRRESGLNLFEKEFKDTRIVSKVSHFDLQYNATKGATWAATLPSETDAVLGAFDFSVVKAQEFIQGYSSLDYKNIKYVGQGGTSWSKNGPNPFASYDYRVGKLVDLTLEMIDTPNGKLQTKRIKPKLTESNRLIK